MPFLLEDDVCVEGISVCRAAWFIVCPHTLLLASATADAALTHSPSDSHPLRECCDVDFTLFRSHVDAAADKAEVVDYAFLSALPQPPRGAGQTAADRQSQLRRWMEECFVAHNAARFPELLRAASPALFFEYDAVLKNIGVSCGGSEGEQQHQRRVRGFVVPGFDGSGAAVVQLTIPLLLEHGAKAFQSLNNVAVLYCKFAHLEWKPSFQVSAVEAALQLHLCAHAKSGRLSVVSEKVTVRVVDGAACDSAAVTAAAASTLAPFLRSCVNVHGLPRLPLTLQGGGFIDFLPLLNDALYRRLREPLHFMKLILGLVSDLGNPLEISVCCKGLGVPGDVPPARRTAVFCVTDSTTSVSFVAGLHYTGGSELPSMEVTCAQYLDDRHEAPLSRRVKYPQTGAAMRKDGDGFIDVEDIRVALVRGVLECMTSLMTCQ